MATKERRYQPPTSLVVAGWVEGIADYERRGSSTPTALGVLDTGTRMQSGTVQGGLDFNWTRTNVPWLDQMVLGIVASRSSAKLDINYGASATLEGWGIGAYWMGVTGPWSLDAVTKLDYFNYTPTGGTPPVPGIPSDFFFTNHTTAANLNYRIPMGWTTSFIEPTVGVMYVRTDADLGILNRATGDLLRLQGGARLGSTWDWWNGVSVLGMVKLLAYSNVHVSGLAVVAPALGGFGPGLASSTDEGKLRGEVEGSLTFGLGAGYSLNAETAVRFGSEYFAAGGKLGLRKAFSASVQAADNRVQPVVYKAAVAPAPWVFEIGARYVYSSAKNWYDLYNDPTPTQLNSRLTYDGLNAHSGEGFFQIDSPSAIFVKGYFGGGSIRQGRLYDEDFPPAMSPYSKTISDTSGTLQYGNVDVGYSFYDSRGLVTSTPVRFGGFHWLSLLARESRRLRLHPDCEFRRMRGGG